ncbi:hypothetical protein OH76DRAFT_775186 [Lentinus brumalis]|uniref:Uncharacterized protein n=1 Tax=Lentinus brumalis TaxID=2498619 RepID=A0A371D4C7_9APHY|nr:hypothetical protein OH76DRAFT_775186 [Polyporus brumalis]
MTTTLFSAFSSSSPVSVSALGNATYVNNGGLQPGMNGSPRVGGHTRHTPLPPLPAVGSGAPSSPASWPCPSLGHSRTSSFSSTSSSLLLTPPPGATLASFVGFGQRAQLSPPSPTRFSPTMSGSERDGEHVENAERKYVLLRDPQGWYFNVPESALETSPDSAPRALSPAHHTRSPVRAPPSPRLLPAALPPSPAMPLVTVSSPQGTDALGLSVDTADDTRLWPSSSHASGTFVSGSSNRSPWSSPQNVSHSPLWGATGLPHPPRTSSLTQGLAVGLRVVESWSPSPARLGRSFASPTRNSLSVRVGLRSVRTPATHTPSRAPAYLLLRRE